MRYAIILYSLISFPLLIPCQVSAQTHKRHLQAHQEVQEISIHFMNVVDGKRIVLHDSTYTDSFGEPYSISKLRYYVSNIQFVSPTRRNIDKQSYLIDESKPVSQVIKLRVRKGTYTEMRFLLGVDSIHNVSGAQSGSLDPLNDMFWTWNSGYVMLKFEGTSVVSHLHNKIFEYHIGGFSGSNNVLHEIHLKLNGHVGIRKEEGHKDIYISAELNKLWKGDKDIRIATQPSVTTPGTLAKQISNNYSNMFTIETNGK